MKVVFDEDAWDTYVAWHKDDGKIVQRINKLICHIQRSPFEGIGKPEPLRGTLSGCWSRRIIQEHRMVYEVAGDELRIAQLKYHY